MVKMRFLILAIMLAAAASFSVFSQEDGEMSFFITSAGAGRWGQSRRARGG